MKLEFKSIKIESFLSVGCIEANLSNRGITLVRGINEYEPKLDSNGSGKSSIFDAIIWCLLGCTTRDVSRVSNENLDQGARVELHISINNNDYIIVRTENPKTLTLTCNGEDISGNTYTKSQSILEEHLDGLGYDALISIVILSQGLPGRFTSLKPKDRKARLEYLSGIDGDLLTLIDKVNTVIDNFNKQKHQCISRMSEVSGEIISHNSIIKSSQAKIDDFNTRTQISEEEYNKISEEYNLRNELASSLQEEISISNSELSSLDRQYYSLTNSIINDEKYVSDLQSQLRSYMESKCPTCGSQINCSDKIEECTKILGETITRLDSNRQDKSSLELKIENTKRLLESQKEKSLSVKEGQEFRLQQIREFEVMKNSVEIYESNIRDSQSKIKELEEVKNSIETEVSAIDKNLAIASFYKNNLNKKFRTFLLDEVITFMNDYLSKLSKYLYEVQGIVHLESSGNNIKIYLGDREFGALSGGEGRRVDLILQLAQRYLCEVQSGFSCNLLVIDEILDYLDVVGVDNVLALLESNSNNVDTLMIVTHRPDLNITFDSVFTVIKDVNQISTLVQV